MFFAKHQAVHECSKRLFSLIPISSRLLCSTSFPAQQFDHRQIWHAAEFGKVIKKVPPKLFIPSTIKTQMNYLGLWHSLAIRAVPKISTIFLNYPTIKFFICVPEYIFSVYSTWYTYIPLVSPSLFSLSYLCSKIS